VKYEIYSERSGKVLGWAATISSATSRAAYFIEANPKIYIRESRSKRIAKILTKKDFVVA
jgi:hypothetical protein